MSQTVTSSFAAQDASAVKNLDYAFVISGWPTIYTVAKDSYAFGGALAGFSAIRPWADLPAAVGAAVKGRPEEGALTLGEMEVSILDRFADGARSLTSLVSREADLRGPAGSSGTATKIAGGTLSAAATTVPLVSAAGLPSSGKVYVGLECIKYESISGNSLMSCTRGHLLTSPTPHPELSYVYTFMPNLFRRKAYVYKGYQNLGLADWAPAFGGAITGVEKQGAAIRFRVMSTTWHTYNEGKRVAIFLGKKSGMGLGAITMSADILPEEFASIPVDLTDAPSAAELTDLNFTYLLDFAGELTAITGAT